MFVTLDLASGRKRVLEELDAIILQSKLKCESSIKTADIAFIAAAFLFNAEPVNAATIEIYHRTFAEGLLEFGESLVLPFAEGFINRNALKEGIKYLKSKSINK